MMSQGKKTLRFVTWNTHGIRSPQGKFQNIQSSLCKLDADIAFIQETRVGPKCYEILTHVKDWEVYFTVHCSSSKGVAILIKKKIDFKYICHDEDCSGGYIVLFCHLYGKLYTLVNVYNHKADKNVLGRLKEYLMETAEGVLVVGGDFNTVLHPWFDRSPSGSRHSEFRGTLEDFTTSLNLRDTWSYLNFSDEGFTRRQNESKSRLDMFFINNVRQARNITVTDHGISDHNPVVLDLEVQQQNGKEFPNVSLLLRKCGYREKPNRMSGKISGEEILSAMKTLIHSKETPYGQRDLSYYKKRLRPVTEILKVNYNKMLRTSHVSDLKKSYRSKGRHVFKVEYLIFTHILVKRLRAYILPNFKKNIKKTTLDQFLILTVVKKTQKMNVSFLHTCLEFIQNLKKKLSPNVPPTRFHILENLLPNVTDSFATKKLLLPDCPLTSTILNLALIKLNGILNNEKKCMSIVCFQRQALLIHAHHSKQDKVVWLINEFQRNSGIKFQRKPHQNIKK